MEDPSLFRIFHDGGPLMLVALVWMFLFLLVSILIFVGRLKKSRWTLMIFPLGFGILALSYFVMQWHFHFKHFQQHGPPDPVEYVENSLRITRATLMICSAAGFSFVVTVLGVCIPQRTDLANKTENPTADRL